VTIHDYPRLCGGTFFTLVLQDLRQRMKAREHYKGDRDGLTDPEVLMGLIKVINPDYQEIDRNLLKTKANDYKTCKTSTGTYLPFGETQEIRAFDDRVKRDYKSALKEMTAFVCNYLDLGEAVGKATLLVKALIDLIQQDETIDASEGFFIGAEGQKIKKTALGGLKEVYLPAFLLGVWHYAVVNRKNNKVGQITYDEWCPSTGGGPRDYTAHMGEGILDGLHVNVPESAEQDDTDDDVIIEVVPEDQGQAYQSEGPAQQNTTSVVNNNPIFIQQTGDGNMVIPNYGTININKR
jgi:hypothetical protein